MTRLEVTHIPFVGWSRSWEHVWQDCYTGDYVARPMCDMIPFVGSCVGRLCPVHGNMCDKTARTMWCKTTSCVARLHCVVSMLFTATHCNTLQHAATHCNTLYGIARSIVWCQCRSLQHTATHCNTLHRVVQDCVLPHMTQSCVRRDTLTFFFPHAKHQPWLCAHSEVVRLCTVSRLLYMYVFVHRPHAYMYTAGQLTCVYS